MDQDLITFGDTLTWSLGRHSIKAGADFVYNDAVDGFAVNRGSPRGAITYSGSGPNALASFLQGLGPRTATFVNQPRPPMDVSNWETGYFVQDDFRVNHRLTLNLGMRYEFFTPFVDKNDLMANFDPNYNNATLRASRPVHHSVDEDAEVSRSEHRDVWLHIGRRFGPGRRPRSGAHRQDRLRSACGRSLHAVVEESCCAADMGSTIRRRQLRVFAIRSPPTRSITLAPTITRQVAGLLPVRRQAPAPITGGTLKPFGNTPTANYVPVNLRNPRTQQWNVTYEQQIPWQSSIRFSYIGAKQTGQIVGTGYQYDSAQR